MQIVARAVLYEQVLSNPMTRVAADYGVTGTALKKTCDRQQAPMTERGRPAIGLGATSGPPPSSSGFAPRLWSCVQ